MPSDFIHYVEPYAGGLSVLLARNPDGTSEVVNDMDGDLVNFWRVLRDPESFADLKRMLDATPFSEAEWHACDCSGQTYEGEVNRAWAFFVRCRQSLSGRRRSFTGVTRTRTRRGMNNEVSAWLSSIEGLSLVHDRLRRVLILNRPALSVIRSEDSPATVMYLDPPYLQETRASPDVYACEMSAQDHQEMLHAVKDCASRILLSGYRSDLYDSELKDWRREDIDVANHASGAKTKRRMTECVWMNY